MYRYAYSPFPFYFRHLVAYFPRPLFCGPMLWPYGGYASPYGGYGGPYYVNPLALLLAAALSNAMQPQQRQQQQGYFYNYKPQVLEDYKIDPPAGQLSAKAALRAIQALLEKIPLVNDASIPDLESKLTAALDLTVEPAGGLSAELLKGLQDAEEDIETKAEDNKEDAKDTIRYLREAAEEINNTHGRIQVQKDEVQAVWSNLKAAKDRGDSGYSKEGAYMYLTSSANNALQKSVEAAQELIPKLHEIAQKIQPSEAGGGSSGSPKSPKKKGAASPTASANGNGATNATGANVPNGADERMTYVGLDSGIKAILNKSSALTDAFTKLKPEDINTLRTDYQGGGEEYAVNLLSDDSLNGNLALEQPKEHVAIIGQGDDQTRAALVVKRVASLRYPKSRPATDDSAVDYRSQLQTDSPDQSLPAAEENKTALAYIHEHRPDLPINKFISTVKSDTNLFTLTTE